MAKKKMKARGKKVATHRMPDGHMMSNSEMKKKMRGKKMPPKEMMS